LKSTSHEERNGWLEKTYQAWQEGEIRADEALTSATLLVRLETNSKPLTRLTKKARAYLSEVVNYLGGKAEVDGFGQLQITNPSVTYTYDKKLVDRLTNELRTEGLGDVATRLDACLKASEKAGSLRITREKKEGSEING
jgi:hypothetical protein